LSCNSRWNDKLFVFSYLGWVRPRSPWTNSLIYVPACDSSIIISATLLDTGLRITFHRPQSSQVAKRSFNPGPLFYIILLQLYLHHHVYISNFLDYQSTTICSVLFLVSFITMKPNTSKRDLLGWYMERELWYGFNYFTWVHRCKRKYWELPVICSIFIL
jgi:hypothetical protein